MTPPTGSKPSTNNGCGLAALCGFVVLIVLAVSQGTSTLGGNASEASLAAMNEAMTTALADQSPPAVQPFSKASARRGVDHLRQAIDAEGLSGAMIYSQNCYDALSRTFSWAKLDQCGAFDMRVVRAMGDDDVTGFDKETAWFQSETAAGRYLATATAAGEDADKADVRLSSLQSEVSRLAPAAAPAPADAAALVNSVDPAPVDLDGNNLESLD